MDRVVAEKSKGGDGRRRQHIIGRIPRIESTPIAQFHIVSGCDRECAADIDLRVRSKHDAKWIDEKEIRPRNRTVDRAVDGGRTSAGHTRDNVSDIRRPRKRGYVALKD